MKRLLSVVLLGLALLGPVSLLAQCPVPNINNPNALTIQGPGTSGGYPVPVTTNTGCPLDVTSSGGLSACVTQCTSPWIVSGTVTANQGTSPWVCARSIDPASGVPDGLVVRAEGTAAPGFASGGCLATNWYFNNGLVPKDASQIASQGSSYTGSAVFPCYQIVSVGGNLGLSMTGLRTPTTFNTAVVAAAGNTVLWTPAAGKKFRLMRWRYTVTESATTAGGADVVIKLFDGAAGATGQQDTVTIPAVALATSGQLASSPWIDLGNGYLSTAPNNVLNVNLSAALTAGTVTVEVCGTEE